MLDEPPSWRMPIICFCKVTLFRFSKAVFQCLLLGCCQGKSWELVVAFVGILIMAFLPAYPHLSPFHSGGPADVVDLALLHLKESPVFSVKFLHFKSLYAFGLVWVKTQRLFLIHITRTSPVCLPACNRRNKIENPSGVWLDIHLLREELRGQLGSISHWCPSP